MDFSDLLQSLFGSPAPAVAAPVPSYDDALRRQIASNIINRTQIARDQPYPAPAPIQLPSNAGVQAQLQGVPPDLAQKPSPQPAYSLGSTEPGSLRYLLGSLIGLHPSGNDSNAAPQNMLAAATQPQTAMLAQPQQSPVTVPPSPFSLPNTPPQVDTGPALPQVPTPAPSQGSPVSAALLSPQLADPASDVSRLQSSDPWAGLRQVTAPQTDQTMTASTNAPAQAALASAAASSPSIWQKYQNFTASDRGQALNAFFTGLAMGKTPQQSLGYGAEMVSATAPQRQKKALMNQTAKWLVGRGMDANEAALLASNPSALADYLKTSINGAKPVAVGQGSALVDPKTGKVIYQAPATNSGIKYGQTPLMLTDPQGKMHMGQMSNGGGILIDGKTYDSLPSGWKAGTVSQSGSGGLSDSTIDFLWDQYKAGDKSAIQGFSRSATARSQIANGFAKRADAEGMNGTQIAAQISAYGGNVAAQRSAGTRAAQVGMAASEANKMADVAIEASSAVPRDKFVPWNVAVNAVRTSTSSPQMAAFVTATTSLVNAYARAVSPLGAPTDAMRQHAEQMLNTAQSPQAYAAVINQMKKEMEAALNAPAEISNQLKEQITGAHPETQPAAAPAQTGADNQAGWTDLGGGIKVRKLP